MLRVEITYPDGNTEMITPSEDDVVYGDLFSQSYQGSINAGVLILTGGDLDSQLPQDGFLKLSLVRPEPRPDYWIGGYQDRLFGYARIIIGDNPQRYKLMSSLDAGGFSPLVNEDITWTKVFNTTDATLSLRVGVIFIGDTTPNLKEMITSWCSRNKIPIVFIEWPELPLTKAIVDNWADTFESIAQSITK